MKSYLIICLLLALGCNTLTYAQGPHQVTRLRGFSNQSNIDSLSNALLSPVLVYHSAVYVISPKCWPRNADGGFNARNADGASNDRNAGGASNDRNADGASNDRASDGENNDRNSGGGSNIRENDGANNDRNAAGNSNDRDATGSANDRNSTGNANDRANSGAANDRNQGGGALNFFCDTDPKGKLTIYFENCKPDKETYLFYNHRRHTTSSKTFKLRIL